MIILGSKVYNDTGPEVAIDCLWCGRQSVKAQTRQETGWLTLFHFVPFLRIRNVFVRCSACGKDMIAKCSLADVEHSSPVTLQQQLIKGESFVGRVCILLGALLCWAPMIGLIPAVIGFFFRNQFGPAMKTLSWIGLILSLLTTALVIILLLLTRPWLEQQ
jgi:hypothetical protein